MSDVPVYVMSSRLPQYALCAVDQRRRELHVVATDDRPLCGAELDRQMRPTPQGFGQPTCELCRNRLAFLTQVVA